MSRTSAIWSAPAREGRYRSGERSQDRDHFGDFTHMVQAECPVVRAGWHERPLGDVAVFETGRHDGSPKPYVGMEHIEAHTGRLVGALDQTAVQSSTFAFDESHVLYGRLRPYLNKVHLPEFSGHCSTEIFPVRPRPGLDRRYLFHWFTASTTVAKIVETCTGARMPRADLKAVRDLPIPLPPLAEQRRIVAILDEAFEAIAAATANAERNLASARELFSRALRLFFSRAACLQKRALGDVCEMGSRLVDPRADRNIDLVHVGAGNIESRTGRLIQLQTAREEGLISGKYLFDRRMVLYSKIRPYLEKVARPDFDGLCSADMYPLQPTNSLTRDFLFYLLLSPQFTEYAIRGSARAGMPKVNQDHLFAYPAAVPSILQQQETTQCLDRLMESVGELGAVYNRKLAALTELKQSLLARAFVGELSLAIGMGATQPEPNTNFATPEHVANIIALAYRRHESANRAKTFGHVKAQKMLHLVESIGGIELGRQPWKDAAGPNDFPHMRKAEEWARENQFFEFAERLRGYDFKKLGRYGEMLSRASRALEPVEGVLNHVVDLLTPFDTQKAELLATVHAAWNNLVRDGKDIDDGAIVREARDDWHPDKLKIAEFRFREMIKFIRRNGLVPDGRAKLVRGQAMLL